jgi:hypothetical protein
VGPVRRAITVLAVVASIAGPTALAFFQGGYFDLARLVAAIVAWLLLGVAALVSPQPLPRGRAGRIALAGLVLLTAWTGLSIAWAPLSAPATDALQRDLLYVAAFAAAAALLREPLARRAAEPLVALGVLVVVAYGLLDRLLPGVFTLDRSTGAFGRLEQPLTYWNAMGALAAIGALLCARLAGDPARPRWLRAAAAAGGVPLAVGVWLSFSRGVFAALGVGLLALAALALTRAQLRAIAVALAAAVPAAIAAYVLHGVRGLEGSLAHRERDGLAMLAILLALSALAAAGTWLLARAELSGRLSAAQLPLPRAAAIALAVAVVAVAGLVVGLAATDRGHAAASGASAKRFASVESNRYAYWKVALRDGFAADPLKGVGSGGFAVIWLEHRDVKERAKVAHSLYVETLAELGLVGIVLLLAFLGGVAGAAARAVRRAPAAAAGPVAVVILWATHCALDWDWQMPALTLPVLLLAGLIVSVSEEEGEEAVPA